MRRGIAFGFIFTACVVGLMALTLLSFNGCGDKGTESPKVFCNPMPTASHMTRCR